MLESLGIRRSLLRKLSIDDLVEVRMSPAFTAFRDAYSTFATTLQELGLRSRRVSQHLLGKSKEQMKACLLAQYFIESDRYESYVKLWNVSEMGFFSLALGAGFFRYISGGSCTWLGANFCIHVCFDSATFRFRDTAHI
jgi:hypothetical protein